MDTVFFSPVIDARAIRSLFEHAALALAAPITAEERVAIKVHFGEEGNTRFVSPAQIKPVIEALQSMNHNYFLTDANTLYRGMRYNAADHMRLALEHGFGTLDTPIVIADGEDGSEEAIVPIAGRIFTQVRIARAIAQADVIVAVSHFKGHVMFGFGGAIKNIGMGSGSRAGKLAMHSKIHPKVGPGCTGCGECVQHCAARAIALVNDRAVIDPALCTGCAKCIAVCALSSIEIPWGGASSREVQARCAEHALGAAKGKRIICLTFITNITKDCDCMSDTRLIGQDVGLIAGTDPVACDQAAYDLVVLAHGEDIFKKATRMNGLFQLEHAAAIGLGSPEYVLNPLA